MQMSAKTKKRQGKSTYIWTWGHPDAVNAWGWPFCYQGKSSGQTPSYSKISHKKDKVNLYIVTKWRYIIDNILTIMPQQGIIYI